MTTRLRGLADARELLGTTSAALAILLALSTVLPAFAQDDEDDDGDPYTGVEQMVVQGEGAFSTVPHVTVSAIAFDEDYLDAIGAEDIADVSTFTPNVEIRTPFAASNPTLFIRGVGLRDFNANSNSSVAVYNDEIPMNSPAAQLAQLFDVERIDVLRGPQATRYGRNASAGTIRVIARKPRGLNETSGSVTYGRFHQVDVDVALEKVIVEDRLTMRSAAKWSVRRGTTKNRCADSDFTSAPPTPEANGRTQQNRENALATGAHRTCFAAVNVDPILSPPGRGWVDGEVAPVKEWVNDTRNWAARTILRFEHPFLGMDWQLNLHGGQNRGDARQFQMVAAFQRATETRPGPAIGGRDLGGYIDPDNRVWRARKSFIQIRSPTLGNAFEGDYDDVEKEKIDLFGSSLAGVLDLGRYRLTSITGYEWNKRDTIINLDASPLPGLTPELRNSSYQLSQELRLDYDGGHGTTWQLGGMFLYEALDVRNLFRSALTTPEIAQEYTFFTRYFAPWLDVAWSPVETFEVKAGARLNYEEKETNLAFSRNRIQFGTGSRIPVTFPQTHPLAGQPIPPRRGGSSVDAWGWAGEIVLTWSPATDVAVYARYARGWKGPHINGSVLNPAAPAVDATRLPAPAEPEKVDSIETGMKAKIFGERVGFSTAFFYYDYQDLQVYQLRNAAGNVPVPELINANDADVLGIEAELDLRPFDGWALPSLEGLWIHLTFAWLQSKYTDFVNVFEVQNFDGDLAITTVTQDLTGNRLLNSPEMAFIGFVTWPFGGEWGSLTPRFDWSYKDQIYFTPENSEYVQQKALWLANLRLTYVDPSGRLELAGWIENLTDQAYTIDALNLARLRRSVVHAIGDPRTYGLTVSYRF